VTVGQLAEARTDTGSSETITRLEGRPLAAARCRWHRLPNQKKSQTLIL
jgi:hypothetical protein